MAPLNDVDRCWQHIRYDTFEEVTLALRRKYKNARERGTWDDDQYLRIWQCPLQDAPSGPGRHWHIGHMHPRERAS